MLALSAKIRKTVGKKIKALREKGILPAVLYGPKVKSLPLEIDLKEFEQIYKEAGESTIIKLKIKNQKSKIEEKLVLIKEITRDPLTEKFLHIDFYQPSLKEEVEAEVPIIFEGEAPAVKNLEGTLVKNISQVLVKALPQNLPHEIKVNVESLKTFEDEILIKDLKVAGGVKILKEPGETVALVSPPEKVEEELEKPIEEKVEEVEKIEEEKKEEEKKEKVKEEKET